MSFVSQVRDSKQTRERDTDSVRRRSASLIAAVLAKTEGLPELAVLLALGSHCPFTLQWERNIWIEEIHRLRGES